MTLPAGTLASALASSITGPSSSESPYLVRSQPGVVFASLLTVGDSVNDRPNGDPYRLVGIPDGMGAFDNEDGTFTILLNHELGTAAGIPRAHGAKGAFVSRWVVDKDTLTVLHGEDLIQNVATWNPGLGEYNAPGQGVAFNRFCSADLPEAGAFYHPASGLGTMSRIFMNGEEDSNGRAFAHIVDGPEAGISWELPWMGKFAWENSVASPWPQDKTIVMGLDDSDRRFSNEFPEGEKPEPSEVYVWIGHKKDSGMEVEKAGLYDGLLTGVRVGTTGGYDANELTVSSGERFELVELEDQTANTDWKPLQAESIGKTITQFRRVEDGAWDPTRPNDFYFVTTDRFNGASKLFRLRFDDILNPESGGVIDILLDGTEGQQMMDNLTISKRGSVFIQEDPGNQSYLARIWRYSIAHDTLEEVAKHDPKRFEPGAPAFLTRDEETSGIIPLDGILGEGFYLVNVQAHYSIPGDAELVQGGQVAVMHFPPGREK
jgi:hypothetical protein